MDREADVPAGSNQPTRNTLAEVMLACTAPWEATSNPAFTSGIIICQYCGESGLAQDLTFDHVIPRSRGGRTTWQNIVAACGPCNLKKGGRTPQQAGMPLLRRAAHQPNSWELQEAGRRFPPHFLHQSWLDYLYWDIELEP